MITLSPIVLIIFGLVLNLLGAILISIEAFGASEFIASMKSDDIITSKKTEIGFTASINNIFVFVLTWIICFIALRLLVLEFNIVLDFIIAPLGYVVWHLLIKLANWFYTFIASFSPRKILPKEKTFLLKMIDFILLPFWVIILLVAVIIRLTIQYGLDLPLRFVSEKVIRVGIVRLFHKIANTEKEMQKWHFRKPVFVGALLLIGGFIYQIIGTILILIGNAQL